MPKTRLKIESEERFELELELELVLGIWLDKAGEDMALVDQAEGRDALRYTNRGRNCNGQEKGVGQTSWRD